MVFVPIDYSGQLFLNKCCQFVSFKTLVHLICQFIGMSLCIICLYYKYAITPFNIYICLSDITCFIPYSLVYLLFSPLIFHYWIYEFYWYVQQNRSWLKKNTLCALCHWFLTRYSLSSNFFKFVLFIQILRIEFIDWKPLFFS